MSNTHIISLAQDFATQAHGTTSILTQDNVRREKLVHVQEVVDLVWASGGTDFEIAAAWLHDTVEDTPTTLVQIEEIFGKEIKDIVEGLTDLEHFESMPIYERKCAQAERVATESESVRRIKIADQTSNVRFFALTGKKNLPDDKCREYIKGAKLIADKCAGISPLLDRLFDGTYQLAVKRYLIS